MSDITLTAGIRQNLLSLQQTSADLETTQNALSTGNVQYSTIAGTTAIANDTTQVTSSFTTANVIAGSGANPITASVQSTSEFKSAGFAQLAVGDTLTFQLGAGTTFTATFGVSNSGQTFDNATGLAATLNLAGDFNGG